MQDEAFSTNGGGDDVDGILPFLTQDNFKTPEKAVSVPIEIPDKDDILEGRGNFACWNGIQF